MTVKEFEDEHYTSDDVREKETDYELYKIACDRLSESEYDELDITITGSKYDYVLKYTERFILFEANFNDKRFLDLNRLFFKELDSWLRIHTNDGLEYTKKWNCFVYKAFIEETKRTQGITDLHSEDFFNKDPLEVTLEISKIISGYLFSNPKLQIQMKFDVKLVCE